MQVSKSVYIVAILVLVAAIMIVGFRYAAANKEIGVLKAALEERRLNEKTLAFAKLFIEKVLKADQEVDFETRLALENAVRELKDEEVLAQWQRFTASETEGKAQEQTKNLLELLIRKAGE